VQIITSGIIAGQTAAGAGSMGKAKRGRQKGAKNRKAPDWSNPYAAAAMRNDCGTIERWAMKIGVERIDEANTVRREVFATLALQDREVDAGGRVVSQGAVSSFEHQALDPLRRAGILDDPKEPQRSLWRLEAGVELLNLWIAGRIMGRSTAAWRAVGGGNGGRVSEADCESIAARAEMKYFRAIESVGDENKAMIHAVCLEQVVPAGTKRSKLVNALDLLSEHLFGNEPPADVVRPRLRVRSRS
jgi:hypothetical protein